MDNMIMGCISESIDEKEILFSKEDPVWTKCSFVGPPPIGHASWSGWVEESTDKGLFTGININAI